VIKYDVMPLSPLTRQRLSAFLSSLSLSLFLAMVLEFAAMVRRKILVLDLDETLIHSHHDGIIRPMVKPGTPPDFILRVHSQATPVLHLCR
jgi:CTD nuclear envelope phosphatase 1